MGEQLIVQSDKPITSRRPGQRGKDLTGAEVGDILRWHREGLTQQQIALRFDPPKSQSTISDCLARFGSDRTDDAKAILRASAADMALNIRNNGRAADHVKALQGLSVLTEERAAGLTIQIGVKDSDVTINLSPPSSEGGERKVAETLRISAGSDNQGYVNQG